MKYFVIFLSFLSFSLWADAPSEELTPQDFKIEQEAQLKLSFQLVPEAMIQGHKNAQNALATKDTEDVWEARVGEMAYLIAKLSSTGNTVKDVIYEISFHHIEDDKEVFKTTTFSADGTLVWGQQFFDGAAHLVTLKARPLKEGAFKPIKTELVVGVEGIDPPSGVVIKTMAILLGLTAIALVVGYLIGVKPSARVSSAT